MEAQINWKVVTVGLFLAACPTFGQQAGTTTTCEKGVGDQVVCKTTQTPPSPSDVINKTLADLHAKAEASQAAKAQAAAQSQSQTQMSPWLEQNNRNTVAYLYCRQHPNDKVPGFFGAEQGLGTTCSDVIEYTKAFCSLNPEAGRCKLARSKPEVEQKFAALAEDFRTDPRRNKKDAQMYYDSLFDKLTKWGCMSFPDMSLPQRDGSLHPCPDAPETPSGQPNQK